MGHVKPRGHRRRCVMSGHGTDAYLNANGHRRRFWCGGGGARAMWFGCVGRFWWRWRRTFASPNKHHTRMQRPKQQNKRTAGTAPARAGARRGSRPTSAARSAGTRRSVFFAWLLCMVVVVGGAHGVHSKGARLLQRFEQASTTMIVAKLEGKRALHVQQRRPDCHAPCTHPSHTHRTPPPSTPPCSGRCKSGRARSRGRNRGPGRPMRRRCRRRRSFSFGGALFCARSSGGSSTRVRALLLQGSTAASLQRFAARTRLLIVRNTIVGRSTGGATCVSVQIAGLTFFALKKNVFLFANRRKRRQQGLEIKL
jgi:hypothetical protein